MMWGAFAANGVGRIRFLEKNETCNSAWYLKVLDKQVRWSASLLFKGTFYLQDDGAPCQRSKTVTEFGVPPQSPDLSPIESVWSLLIKRVWSHNKLQQRYGTKGQDHFSLESGSGERTAGEVGILNV